MSERSLTTAEFEQLAAALLGAGRRFRFRASGGSMRPFVRAGDMLEVAPIDPAAVKAGQILACRLPRGRIVAHRVLRVERGSALIQGDALLQPDGWVPAADVIGQVVGISRGAKDIRFDTGWYQAVTWGWLLLTPLRRQFFWLGRFFHLQKRFHA